VSEGCVADSEGEEPTQGKVAERQKKGGILASIWGILGHYQAKNGQKKAKAGVFLLLNS